MRDNDWLERMLLLGESFVENDDIEIVLFSRMVGGIVMILTVF